MDFPAVSFDDSFGDEKPKPKPLHITGVFCSNKTIEDCSVLGWVNSRTMISNGYLYMIDIKRSRIAFDEFPRRVFYRIR